MQNTSTPQDSTLTVTADCSLEPSAQAFDSGVWTGKIQALTTVAKLSNAARAECLRQIRENRVYQATGLTWDQYCPTHVGITRSQADRIIRRLEQFGKRYFDLSEIAPISADKYQAIAPAVSEQGIEIDGEIVPLTPQNAPRIRKAVESVRAELRRAHELRSTSSVTELVSRFDAWFRDVSVQAGHRLDLSKQAELCGLTHYAINKLRELAATFPDPRR
jgi:hypothetical protein